MYNRKIKQLGMRDQAYQSADMWGSQDISVMYQVYADYVFFGPL